MKAKKAPKKRQNTLIVVEEELLSQPADLEQPRMEEVPR